MSQQFGLSYLAAREDGTELHAQGSLRLIRSFCKCPQYACLSALLISPPGINLLSSYRTEMRILATSPQQPFGCVRVTYERGIRSATSWDFSYSYHALLCPEGFHQGAVQQHGHVDSRSLIVKRFLMRDRKWMVGVRWWANEFGLLLLLA